MKLIAGFLLTLLSIVSSPVALAQESPLGMVAKLPKEAKIRDWHKASPELCDTMAMSSSRGATWELEVPVVLVREVDCFWLTRKSLVGSHVEVLIAGQSFAVSRESLADVPGIRDQVRKHETLDADAYAAAKKLSLDLARGAKAPLLKKLASAKKQPVFLSEVDVWLENKYTHFTTFGFVIHNNAPKPIKYATLRLTGFNSVQDPVKDRLSTSPVKTFRGVGPIDSGTRGRYSHDTMWSTTLVQTVTVNGATIEFMGAPTVTLDAKRLFIFTEDELKLLHLMGEEFPGSDEY